jgi:putative ABC transport system permease protein
MTAMDLRQAIRSLRRQPAFAACVIGVLALAGGANAALFTVVHAVVIRPLPLADPDRLITFSLVRPGTDRQPLSIADVRDVEHASRTLDGVASLFGWSVNVTGHGDAERLSGLRVSANFFALTGAQVALGRAIQPGDEHQRVALLSHGTWHRRFGGAPDAVGQPVVLNDERFTVIGVLRPDFVGLMREVDVVAPYAPSTDARRGNRAQGFLRVIARMKPAVTIAEAAADLKAIGKRLRSEHPDAHGADTSVRVAGLHHEISGRSAPMLWALLGAVVLLMLVAGANLASLCLVRGTVRRREAAARLALGASRLRLVGHLLTESLVLGAIGGAGALLVARAAIAALLAVGPADLPRAAEIAIDGPIVLVTLLIAIATSLAAGLAPALHAVRADVRSALQGGERGSSPGGGRARTALVFVEVALATLLLSAAALLARSFQQVQSVDPGFRPANVLSIRLSLPRARYSNGATIDAFHARLQPRIASLAGVRAVAAANVVPMNGYLATTPVFVDGVIDTDAPDAHYRMVSPDYFRALGVPLRSGRAFTASDRRDSAPVAIVNETFAREYLAGAAVGRRLRLDDGATPPREVDVVGVAGDVKHFGLEKEATIEVYVPIAQVPDATTIWLANNMYWIVQTQGEPLAMAAAVRREIAATDPAVAASFVRSMEQWIAGTVAPRRFTLQLVAAFALAALLLANLGVYAVSAAVVSARTREIGIRSALGASRAGLLGLVLRAGLWPVAAGLAAGLAVALLVGETLSGLLFEVAPGDPVSIGAGIATLAAAGVIANLVPAVRALRIDPVRALRCE